MRQFANTVQNQPVDTSEEFAKQENHFFIASKIEDYKVWEDVPPGEYEDEQNLPFSVSFITPRTVRLQASTQISELREGTSLMLAGEPGSDDSWKVNSTEPSTTYVS